MVGFLFLLGAVYFFFKEIVNETIPKKLKGIKTKTVLVPFSPIPSVLFRLSSSFPQIFQ